MSAPALHTTPAPAPISVLGLDHVVLRVRDLDRAEALFRALGFALTPRGFHTGRGSANHTAVFRSGTYVELIWLPDGGGPSPFGDRPEGPVAVALRPSDSHVVHGELQASGFDVPPPRDLSRPVEGLAGRPDARFVNVSLPDVAPPGLRLFACQHLTRDLVWRAEWLDHPNGSQGVVRVIVVDPDPRSYAAPFERLFGFDAVIGKEGALAVHVGRERLDVLSPETYARQFPSLQLPSPSDSRFVGLTIEVASAERASAVLAASGIPHIRASSDRIVLQPIDTGGTLIELVE